jgi:hypothetical protein
MAVIRPDPLVALTLDGDLDEVGAVVVVDGAGTVLGPDWKYEHPETATASNRIRERIYLIPEFIAIYESVEQ